MKKSVITMVAAVAFVFAVGTTSVFAKTPNMGNSFGNQGGPFSERNFNHNNFGNGMMGGHMGFGFGGMEKLGGKIDLAGEVTKVDADKSLVTVKDVDGKETQVHVNPFTKIREKFNPDAKKARKTKRDFDEFTLSDLKAGDYVAVKKMDTETKIIEAARIVVAAKE